MEQPWLNLKDYTPAEHIFFGTGCFLWIVVYYYTIRNIKKKQFIEVPFITVCGNIAWEFLWSWIFITNMGSLFVWGYRIWFFLDCFIVYGLFRYGYKQISIPALSKKSVPLIIFSVLSWGVMLYFYIKNYDAPISKMGAYSGFILNILISGLYITQFLRLNSPNLFSLPIAWCKGVGTLLISVFCFLHFSDWFLLSMCILNALLDGLYIYIFLNYKTTTPVPAVITSNLK
ncbi:MAG: hypothetical protein H7Z13_14525 [Ferruginibacter sp.]|nr:hypothetical protein [Ferruginibacter sp.]